MYKLFSLLVISMMIVSCHSTRMYIVRHAEKSTLPAGNPDLTVEGRARAQTLSGILDDKKIKSIYSTNTNRTRQTAEPLSVKTGVPITTYTNDTLSKFLYRVLDAGQNTLIVGHSNTVLQMLRELSLKPGIKEIPDNDYDNLFIVVLKSKDGPAGYSLRLKERRYGKKSPLVTDTSRQAARMQ